MKAYMFPGQGSQFPGMAKDLYENNETARKMLERANEILGFSITDIMFDGTAEDLKHENTVETGIAEKIIVDQTGHEHRRKERTDNTNAQSHGKTFDRTGTDIHQDE